MYISGYMIQKLMNLQILELMYRLILYIWHIGIWLWLLLKPEKIFWSIKDEALHVLRLHETKARKSSSVSRFFLLGWLDCSPERSWSLSFVTILSQRSYKLDKKTILQKETDLYILQASSINYNWIAHLLALILFYVVLLHCPRFK